MKKIILFITSVVLAMTLCACNDTEKRIDEVTVDESKQTCYGIPKNEIKVGFIYANTTETNNYTNAHDKGRQKIEEMGIECVVIDNVPENENCISPVNTLIDEGCNVIYATNYSYASYIDEIAKENPEVIFGVASNIPVTENLPNVTHYSARVYEGEYVAGIVSGYTMNDTGANKAAYLYPLDIDMCRRDVNAFTLGVRSVNENAEVYAKCIGSWSNPDYEKEVAENFYNLDFGVISSCQFTNDYMSIADNFKQQYAIGFCPSGDTDYESCLVNIDINWAVYYVYDMSRLMSSSWCSENYSSGFSTGLVSVEGYESRLSSEKLDYIEQVVAQIITDETRVFSGEIKDNTGITKVDSKSSLSVEQIQKIDWFCQGVVVCN